jgi:hypothetical protein
MPPRYGWGPSRKLVKTIFYVHISFSKAHQISKSAMEMIAERIKIALRNHYEYETIMVLSDYEGFF